jgi:hypothetical protein
LRPADVSTYLACIKPYKYSADDSIFACVASSRFRVSGLGRRWSPLATRAQAAASLGLGFRVEGFVFRG